MKGEGTMAFYLIDYENKNKAIEGIANLTERDTVVFFYGRNSNSIPFSLHLEIVKSPATFEYYEVKTGGKNALDSQLIYHLGRLSERHPGEEFYIVSSDKDYDYPIGFASEHGETPAKIRRVEQLPLIKTKAKPQEVAKPDYTVQIREQLKSSEKLGLTEEDIDTIFSIIEQYKSKDGINKNLQKHFKESEKVGKILKIIKPLLKGKS